MFPSAHQVSSPVELMSVKSLQLGPRTPRVWSWLERCRSLLTTEGKHGITGWLNQEIPPSQATNQSALRIAIWENSKQSILCYVYSGKGVSSPRGRGLCFLKGSHSQSLLRSGCTSERQGRTARAMLVVEFWRVQCE